MTRLKYRHKKNIKVSHSASYGGYERRNAKVTKKMKPGVLGAVVIVIGIIIVIIAAVSSNGSKKVDEKDNNKDNTIKKGL